MRETKAINSVPKYEDSLLDLVLSVVDQIREDIKSFKYNETLDEEAWRQTLPAPLNTSLGYNYLKQLMTIAGTEKFWKILSVIYGVHFVVTSDLASFVDWRIFVKNVDPDVVNNVDPQRLPGISQPEPLGLGINFTIVNNLQPRLINNKVPELLKHVIELPEPHDWVAVQIHYKNNAVGLNLVDMSKIRLEIRTLVSYFLPVGTAIAHIENIPKETNWIKV